MIKPLAKLDTFISNQTMYRLVVYGLFGIIALGILFSFSGLVHVSGLGIIISLGTLFIVCYVINKLFAVVFDAQTNYESWLITALILTCILPPAQTATAAGYIALAGVLAIASKYLIAYRHRHIFNPAAFAAVVLTLTGWLPAIWWVGTPVLVIFSTLFGIVLLRKLRRFTFFGIFGLVAVLVALGVGLAHAQPIDSLLSGLLLSSPLIFFGTIMVTEPETMPTGRSQQWLYAGLVGALVSSQLHVGPLGATPELSLIIANAFAFAITAARYKQQVRLTDVAEIGSNLREYVFTGPRPISFVPGQYMELTLPHSGTDHRGNRRTFSISSAPGSTEVRFATKLFDKSSSFKTELQRLKVGDILTIGQLNGSFVLPTDPKAKLAWIAGGIGITPFVSMARDMVARKQTRDVTLFYLLSNAGEYAYTKLWEAAAPFGLTVIPILTSPVADPHWHGATGQLTPELIKKYIPDFRARDFYLSGPHGLVLFFGSTLRHLSVSNTSIHSDFFSGY